MKQIAVYVNKEEESALLTEEGSINVYSNAGNGWEVINNVSFSTLNHFGVAEIRRNLREMVNKLGDCRVFVAKETAGQLYYILETHGFNIYEAEGRPEEFLDSILKAEVQEESERLGSNRLDSEWLESERLESERLESDQNKEESKLFPKMLEEGLYYINLKEVMNTNSSLTSKQILLPFIKTETFDCLEVICEHAPKWFESTFSELGYQVSTEQIDNYECKVRVTR